MSIIRMLLADAQPVVRDGIAARVSRESDLVLVDQVPDAESAIVAVRKLTPDIVLTDVRLPRASGFWLIDVLRRTYPRTLVIIFAGAILDGDVARAMEANVSGFISKLARFSRIAEGIRCVAGGGNYFCPEVRKRMARPAKRNGRATPASRMSTLTPREIEIMHHLSMGQSVKEVAGRLHLSNKTVDNHKSSLMAKLDIHDRVELSRFAIREGLVPP